MTNTKSEKLCRSCKYGYDDWCAKYRSCSDCPAGVHTEGWVYCRCIGIFDGEPCPYYVQKG